MIGGEGQGAVGGTLAVVTGAGSGIGRATAHLLAAEGVRVVALDIDGAAAHEVAGAVGGRGHEVDVADRGAMATVAATVLATEGVPDLVVNNAGVGMSGRFCDTSTEDWEWIVGVNLLGVVHGCQVFGPAMLARGSGHVVNVSSGLAFAPRATEPAYVTTKAAVLALSRCLRADWGPRGIGVSVVCPGIVDTAIVAKARFVGEAAQAARVARVRRLFARRGRAPDTVAAAILEAWRADRAVVPVGAEARLGWALHGLLPAAAADYLARATVFGV